MSPAFLHTGSNESLNSLTTIKYMPKLVKFRWAGTFSLTVWRMTGVSPLTLQTSP